jgi:hypothetical protein
VLIGGIGTSTVTPRAPRQGEPAEQDAGPTECRALIPVAAPVPSERSATPSRRPLAAFLAHLIATQTQAPQTRARRRVEPEEAIGVYEVASACAGRAGRRFSQDA